MKQASSKDRFREAVVNILRQADAEWLVGVLYVSVLVGFAHGQIQLHSHACCVLDPVTRADDGASDATEVCCTDGQDAQVSNMI